MLASRTILPTNDQLHGEPNEERRLHHRLRMLERVVRIDALGDSGLGRVQNVSNGGLMIDSRIALTANDPVRVAFDCRNVVQGRVAWQSGSRAGIRFLQPIESSVLIRKVVGDRWEGGARSPRLSVSRAARVTSGSGSFPTIIGNISQRGMNICHDGHLVAGSVVDVAIERGVTLRGRVRWSAGLFAGIELAGTMTVEQLASARNF